MIQILVNPVEVTPRALTRKPPFFPAAKELVTDDDKIAGWMTFKHRDEENLELQVLFTDGSLLGANIKRDFNSEVFIDTLNAILAKRNLVLKD